MIYMESSTANAFSLSGGVMMILGVVIWFIKNRIKHSTCHLNCCKFLSCDADSGSEPQPSGGSAVAAVENVV